MARGGSSLSIADDGIGFAMDETGKSVGSRLIRTFGAQLGGRLVGAFASRARARWWNWSFPIPACERARKPPGQLAARKATGTAGE